MEKVRVAVFTDKWTRGGIEAFIMNICRKIDHERIHIEIFTFQDGTDLYDKELEKLNIKKHAILKSEYITPVKRTFLSIMSFGKFMGYMKENQFQIIHFNISHGVSLIYSFLSKVSGIKIRIVHSHNSSMGNGSGMRLKKFAHETGKKIWLGSANHYWACSDEAANWLFTKKIMRLGSYDLIRNAIITGNYRFSLTKRINLREQLQIEDKYVIGHVGRFITQKNHKFLIDVMKLLVLENRNFRLLLVGEGEMEQEIRSYVKELQLEDYVIFFGPTADVQGVLSAMDLFALPSYFEGNPVVGIEAQANGLKCILSDSITKQAKITELVEYLNIGGEAEVREWVDCVQYLSDLDGKLENRASYAETVKNAGYDIDEIATYVGSKYEEYLCGIK
jgi:glycosyltransferase involved in cell wall biosynthesis